MAGLGTVRAVVQRVLSAEVAIRGEVVGSIGAGLLVLVGVAEGDDRSDAETMAGKVVGLRVFEDAEGKMNLSALDLGYPVLLVSQFTLLGDARRGNRPSFTAAKPPDQARELFQHFTRAVERLGVTIETGRFREHMQVRLINDGPVTILLDSKRTF